jgi:hypothetical protein
MKIPKPLKEKSKKTCSLSVYAIAATLVTSPLAFAAPPFQENQRTVNLKFRITNNAIGGCNSTGMCINASTYDGLDDLVPSEVESHVSVSNGLKSIACYGSAYVNAISVNPVNGNTSIQATLDPLDPSCSNYNWDSGTVTINLSGSYPEGGYRNSADSKSTIFSNGTTHKLNYKSDLFQQTFTGFITGFNGPWSGEAGTYRNIDRELVNLITLPLAFAAPPFQKNQRAVNLKFLGTSNGINACNSTGACVEASMDDDLLTGEVQGYVRVTSSSDNDYKLIECPSSAYVNVFSVNPVNGNTSIQATLDPLDPSCSTYYWDSGTVTVNLSGSYTEGGVRNSVDGKSASFSNGTTYKSNYKSEYFQQTFTGSITGFNSPWSGEADTYRNIDRELVK